MSRVNAGEAPPPWQIEVVVEVPRGGFIKRRSDGRIDFISPLPCPFNYGAATAYRGGDHDLLDAVVLGPRLAAGARVYVPVQAAIRFIDAGWPDDKLICSTAALSAAERRDVLAFFGFYARCKRLLNACRRRRGATRCDGWIDPHLTFTQGPGVP